jgi:outer membrane protein
MKRSSAVFPILFLLAGHIRAQPSSDSLLQQGTLENCVHYALLHQPLLKQSALDEEITDYSIRSKLADWYPQLNFNYALEHFPQLPVSIFQGSPIKVGLENTSSGQFSITQTIFDRDVLLASSSAADVRTGIRQQTIRNKIDVVVAVSKAYYAALETQEQIALLDEDILRLRQSLKDAYELYKGGIVDNTDYKRATISLNSAIAQRRQNQELLKANYSFLKEQMGYPMNLDLKLHYDSTQMEKEAFFDTNQTVQYGDRIEYQLLQTQKHLQEDNLMYYKWEFLPSLSAFGTYTLNYQNDQFSKLYSRNYPTSVVGLELSFPIFEGGKRLTQIWQADLELKRIDYDIRLLKNSISSEYAQAIANYKSNLNTYHILKDNLDLAREVYRTILLQYRAGTKTYLEVITAETDLRTTQVNLTNALFLLLSSKLDVEKALGTISY